jgi:hypothetical protein
MMTMLKKGEKRRKRKKKVFGERRENEMLKMMERKKTIRSF